MQICVIFLLICRRTEKAWNLISQVKICLICGKKQTLEYYTSKPVTHKEIEELDFETRIRKRDELLTQKFSNNEQK